MTTAEKYRQFARSLPEVIEQDHHGIPSYRIRGKIFTTHWIHENRVMLKLPLSEQSIFCSYNAATFYPVPNAWGAKGATFVDLGSVIETMLKDAVLMAYCTVAPAGLAAKARLNTGME